MYGLTQIRRAAALLDGPAGYVPTADEAAEALGRVWSSLAFADTWPPEVRTAAAVLLVIVRRHGPFYGDKASAGSYYDAARRMSAADLREFAGLVRGLVAEADRHEASLPIDGVRPALGVRPSFKPTAPRRPAEASATESV